MDRRAAACVGESVRLPRSRGDGPPHPRVLIPRPRAAPLTRGWTVSRIAPLARVLGCPAHAGMDPSTGRCRRCNPWLPRSRGDGPQVKDHLLASGMAAPLTRGWTLEGCADVLRRRGCPAHAGMDPTARCRAAGARWLPRSRGDGPYYAGTYGRVAQAAPLTRGWTRRQDGAVHQQLGCPAHAGMDPRPTVRLTHSGWLPRSRGNGPSVPAREATAGTAAPAERRRRPRCRTPAGRLGAGATAVAQGPWLSKAAPPEHGHTIETPGNSVVGQGGDIGVPRPGGYCRSVLAPECR